MGFTGIPVSAQLIRFTSEIRFLQLLVFAAKKQTGLSCMPGGRAVSQSHQAVPPQAHTNGSRPAIAIGFSNSPAIS